MPIQSRLHSSLLFLPILSLLGACASTAVPTRQETAPSLPASQVYVQQVGDDVAVIPFTLDGLPQISEPLFQAEVGGHRGLFGLDVGSVDGFVNRLFLKPNTVGGGLDTVMADDPPPTSGSVINTTMRLGTLQWPIRTPVQTSRSKQKLHQLGSLGIGELTQFETIVDYTHKRLVLIRLDSAGHRLVPMPDYTPVDSLPLFFVDNGHVALVARIGDVIDTLALDTGNPIPLILTPATQKRVHAHLDGSTGGWQATSSGAANGGGILDSLVIGTQTLTNLQTAPAYPYMPDIVGYPVLLKLGVIGINQRTHQLLLYRKMEH